MVAPLDRQQLLAAVERSPQAAAEHDRAAWVALFTPDGRIEDPVGSRPHLGRTQIGRFYDTFIAPGTSGSTAISTSSSARRCCAIWSSRWRWARRSPCTFPRSCATTFEKPTASG